MDFFFWGTIFTLVGSIAGYLLRMQIETTRAIREAKELEDEEDKIEVEEVKDEIAA